MNIEQAKRELKKKAFSFENSDGSLKNSTVWLKDVIEILDALSLLTVVSDNEAIDLDLDFVVKFPIKKATNYKLKKKDSKVAVCPNCKGTGRDGHDRCYPPNWYVCEICKGSG